MRLFPSGWKCLSWVKENPAAALCGLYPFFARASTRVLLQRVGSPYAAFKRQTHSGPCSLGTRGSGKITFPKKKNSPEKRKINKLVASDVNYIFWLIGIIVSDSYLPGDIVTLFFLLQRRKRKLINVITLPMGVSRIFGGKRPLFSPMECDRSVGLASVAGWILWVIFCF